MSVILAVIPSEGRRGDRSRGIRGCSSVLLVRKLCAPSFRLFPVEGVGQLRIQPSQSGGAACPRPGALTNRSSFVGRRSRPPRQKNEIGIMSGLAGVHPGPNLIGDVLILWRSVTFCFERSEKIFHVFLDLLLVREKYVVTRVGQDDDPGGLERLKCRDLNAC